jgi:RNA methyltransferase, TrmH family
MTIIRSRDNPRVRRWAKLATDSRLRRKEERVLIEGPHLVAEALQAGLEPVTIIVSETGLKRPEVRGLIGKREPVVLADRIFGIVADAETPPGIAAEIEVTQRRENSSRTGVFLEGVQDPGNVGAILRSAAAFEAGEVILDRACADPWSPKVLRAAMGAHFKLQVRQVAGLEQELEAFKGTTICTVSNGGMPLKKAELRGRLGWIFGAEGSGVSEAILRHATLRVTIPMAAGTESINVAAAAAICLFWGSRIQ